VIVLGIDAMDYGITQSLMAEGRLPNLRAIAERGAFMPLQTSMPPLSPVAWSNFICGTDPGGHGITDFLSRDPARVREGFLPEDGVTRMSRDANAETWSIPGTSYVWPTESYQTLRRQAPAFWELLEDQGVRTIIYKVPANFPVSATSGKTLSGMGTPDIEGTYGTFTYLSDRPADCTKEVSGGRIVKVGIEHGEVSGRDENDGRCELMLTGPANVFLPNAPVTHVPFQVHVDVPRKTAAVTVQSRDIVLKQGEWSDWVPVTFELIRGLKSIEGIVRFYLQEAGSSFRMYISPVNLPPGTAGLATSGLDVELANAIGLYDTKGMPQETKAFTQGLFSADEYLQQSDGVLSKDVEALNYLLTQKFDFLFFYFSTVDLDSHVFWRHQDVQHPAYDAAVDSPYANVIRDRYVRMDQIVGQVMSQLGANDVLYIMSDHGFTSFRREFNLVAWLEEQGYLIYTSPVKKRLSQFYSDIDWSQTRAYGVGFSGVYLNLKGREAAGVVDPSEADALLEQIRTQLLSLTDQGQPVFHQIYRSRDIYRGSAATNGPDLILGYNAGYGPSDHSVLGTWSSEVLADHRDGFSGQHEVDYVLVPAVLFSTRKLPVERAALQDVTATVLKEFGVPAGPQMTGRPLF
jgi:predicted AlkP superfamily phosphohydrolase/phosphomutase